MTVAHSRWRRFNLGHYIVVKMGETETVMVDVAAELDTGDFLTGARSTATGITFVSTTVRLDEAAGYTNPHQILVTIRPQSTGTHSIKLEADSNNGLVIVKHFDVLVEE